MSKSYMQNRELSMLRFNERVLLEANHEDSPLIERLRYISIFCNNLDEFYMVRVGTLSDQMLLDKGYVDNKTGMTAQEQLAAINAAVTPLYATMGQSYGRIRAGLTEAGIDFCGIELLDEADLKYLKRYFISTVLPLLAPYVINEQQHFPHLANKQMHVAAILQEQQAGDDTVRATLRGKQRVGIIPIPPELDRLIVLPSYHPRFVMPEDLIMFFSALAFGNFTVAEQSVLSITRNADINVDEEEWLEDDAEDVPRSMKLLLKRRTPHAALRLDMCAANSSDALRDYFCDKLNLSTKQVMHSEAPLDFPRFASALEAVLPDDMKARLTWPKHIPAEVVPEKDRADMVAFLADGKDLLLEYPFESMSPFLAMVRQAAACPDVTAIKITLYRIDKHSHLANSLMLAAENGKEVTVLTELRARFDEANNIDWSKRLAQAGCKVLYGLPDYKVHSKICQVTRVQNGKAKRITQIGTGNYNEKTSAIYTDYCLMTSNEDIALDTKDFFEMLEQGNVEKDFRQLLVAPHSLRSTILDLIDVERKKAKKGEPARILIKSNAVSDKKIIKALEKASRAGVQIHMIIRGICCILPNIPGHTENIHITSIVGKFLEHSRVYSFGAQGKEQLYISSADLMSRNTTRRVEVACPILDPQLKSRIIHMLEVQLSDNTNASELQPDGTYQPAHPKPEDNIIDSQKIFTKEAQAKTTQ